MKKLLCFLLLLSLGACSHLEMPTDDVAMPNVPKPTPKRELIIVDAGHGGKDAGTSNKKDRYEEKVLTLETAFLISDALKQLGYKTLLTRSNDIFLPLETRAEIANSVNADLFVSIHYNFSSSASAEGIEVYYYKENKSPNSSRITQSKELAGEVLKKVIKNTGAESRGLKTENFAVIRETKMPAILIEGGFLSNPKERERLHDPRYLQELAGGIAHGVDQYLKTHRK